MSIIALTVLSGSALALEPITFLPGGGCGTRPPPCLRILDSDGHIMPPDWMLAADKELGGEMRWFRAELFAQSGAFDIRIGDYVLDERWFSDRESTRESEVYYVPLSVDNIVMFYSTGREEVDFILEISGAVEPGF